MSLLSKEPADMPPLNLIVDDTKWKVGKNRAPPRFQSSVKQTALFNTIQTLISQGIDSGEISVTTLQSNPDGSETRWHIPYVR